MEFDESIYNLIPKEQFVPEKGKRYKSQFPPTMAPTASTFGLKTTSKNVCANLSGKYNLEGGAHAHTGATSIFGAPKGALKPDTTMFKKKGTGNPVLIEKTEGKFQFFELNISRDYTSITAWHHLTFSDLVGKFDRAAEKKPVIPKEKPIHGLVSDKNFIVANAVENILAGK